MSHELREQLQSSLGTTYSLERELGGGGMSRVFLARDPALGRDVVIKVLHPDLAGGVNVDRFKREIQLAAQLQHPHIVPLLSAGEMGGLPYLTMPFVAGRSLRERLAEAGALPLEEAVGILKDVARALAFAHGRGVIHRDIKPDNVLLAEGSATVTDFGIAKALVSARERPGAVWGQSLDSDPKGATEALTGLGTSIGTPAYMAPEQAAGDPVTDHRADLYAFGVMAYEMLAGRTPFTAREPHKLLVAHLSEAPRPIREHRPDCPPSLERLVMQCLAKDPAARPQAASEVVRALAEVAGPSAGAVVALPAIGVATRRALARALAFYATAFVLVAALAYGAVVTIGLPEWVLPGTLVVMALGLPVILFTAFVHHGSRVARTMAVTHTPGGTPSTSSTMARLAVKASPHVTWRRTALGGVAAVGAFAALVAGFMITRAMGIGPAASLFAKGVMKESDRVLVADFRAPAGDSTLGTVLAEGVRTGLAQSRAVAVVPSTEVAAALRRMTLPPSSRVDLALAKQIAEREGIKAIVDGQVTPVGASYILTVRLVGGDGAELASFQESAKDGTELIPAVDRATRKLRGKMGESLKTVRETMSLEQATTASLPALRQFTEGTRANALRQDYPAAIAALEEAIALDSTFALAMRLAALAYGNAGLRPGRADTLREHSFRLRDRLPDLERALVEAAYYGAGRHADRARAIAANLRALELNPTSGSALNSLAGAYVGRRQYARAESLYAIGRAQPGASAFMWQNAVASLVSQGKLEEADSIAAEYIRRFPGNPNVPTVSWTVRGARWGRDSVWTVCEQATTSRAAQIRTTGFSCLAVAALMEGRLRDRERLAAQARTIAAERGAVVRSELDAQVDSAFLDIWFRGRGEEGARRLDALLARRPLRERPRDDQPYLTLAEYYAWAGRPDRAREMLSQYERDVADTARRRLDIATYRRALGEVALAEGKYDVAIRELQKADTSYDGAPIVCAACIAPRLARAYDLAGRTDQAIATFEAYLGSKWAYRGRDVDWQFQAGTHKRLGELYEAKGEREKAASHYAAFIDLWKNADPELQPKVAEAKARLARLGGERSRAEAR